MIRLLGTYLSEKKYGILLFAVVLTIFGLVYQLYEVVWEPFVYAAVLSFLMGLLYLLAGFAHYFSRHQKRQQALASIEQSWNQMEQPRDRAEADYQQMIDRLGRRCTELTTSFQTERQESLDYYTTWVHQIKTPIAVMRMILKGEDTETNRELLAELFRVEQYVEMVLSYIRLGSDSKDFVFQEYALNDLIRQSIRKYAPQFIRRKIRLIYIETDVKVLTDEKWLCFLMEQLLSNAVKYTVSGSVTISVSQDLVLTIRDTGMGIAPEDLPRIFEKGFTGYNGRADRKSTGLGLYLCKQTADKLGHHIWVESEVGKGTAVHIDLAKRKLNVK